MGDIINGFFDAMGWVLAFFYGLVPNYAIAIALLTLAVMLVTTPVTLKGTKSMLQMQALQPEMKRIQTKYKDDRELMNQELMKFYQENSINPLGGCLPLLVQAPIFLVLFRLVQGLTRMADDGVTFDPDHLPLDSKMYQDLAGSTEMSSFGIDLSRSASSVLGDGITTFLPYLLLIAVVAVTSFYQQYQIRSRNPNAAQAPGAAVMKFLPLITVVFAWSFAAALVVYFVTSNLYRVGQQAYITKSLYGAEDSAGRKAQEAAAEARKAKQETTAEPTDPDAKNFTPAKGRPTPSRDEAREQAAKKAKAANRSKKKKKRR
jgi:YidC/Oxa1 family membrane protein insertase